MEFKEKNILITGATGGFGSKLANKFFSKGANLILLGKNSIELSKLKNKLLEDKSEDQFVLTIVLDLSKHKAINSIIINQLKEIKKIDVLINCAAIQGPIGKSWENNFKDWKKCFDINFYSVMILTNSILPFLFKSDSGSIINISGGGSTSSRPDFSSYAISKTAIVRYSEILADELSGNNIRVNSVAPGIMATKMLKQVVQNKKNISNPREFNFAQKVFLNGDDMNMAINLCLFLSSDESDGITGKLISANWDPWQDFKLYKEDLMNSDIYTLKRIIPEDRGMNWQVK